MISRSDSICRNLPTDKWKSSPKNFRNKLTSQMFEGKHLFIFSEILVLHKHYFLQLFEALHNDEHREIVNFYGKSNRILDDFVLPLINIIRFFFLLQTPQEVKPLLLTFKVNVHVWQQFSMFLFSIN